MSERPRILFLIFIMTSIAISVAGITLYTLYNAAMDQQRARLVETAHSQARLLEAIARYDWQTNGSEHTFEETLEATLSQVRDAHARFKGFGETGEFTLARLEGDQIVFLLSHRHHDLDNLQPVPFSAADLAEPMRRALSGESGTVIGPDYRGETVLAAYEPLPELKLGIVAKIDLAEIQQPFIHAGVLAGGLGSVVILLGTLLFWRMSTPLLRHLEENEAKYRNLFENANDVIFIIDPLTQRFLDINEKAAQRFGYTRREFLQLTLVDLDPTTSTVDSQTIIQRSQGNSSTVFEHAYRRKDGTEIPVEISSRIIEYSGQRILQSIVRDITARKQVEALLRESEERYRTLFEDAPIGFCLSRLDGPVLMINHAMRHLLGYSANDLPQFGPGEFCRDQDDRERLLQQFQTNRSVRDFETALSSKDDASAYVSLTIVPFPSVGEDVVLTMMEDITQQKMAEQQRLALELELEKAKIVADFIRDASHEIRTPLSIINANLYLLNKMFQEEKGQERLAIMQEQVIYMDRLVNDLLAMVRLDSYSEESEFVSIDLSKLVHDVEIQLYSRIQEKQLHLKVDLCDHLPLLQGKEQDLQRAVNNLLDNAFRYTPAGGKITIRTYLDEDYVVIEIKDTGIGIAEQHLPHIFERFYRADEPRSTRGTGLGLAIVKKITEIHQGYLEVNSTVEKGSIFRMFLPIVMP